MYHSHLLSFFKLSAHFRHNSIVSSLVHYQTLTTLTNTCDWSITEAAAPLSAQTQELCADKRATASVPLKTMHTNHACVNVCFDWHSFNWDGWLPGKLTADNVCVPKVMCVLGVEGGLAMWGGESGNLTVNVSLLKNCEFLPYVWMILFLVPFVLGSGLWQHDIQQMGASDWQLAPPCPSASLTKVQERPGIFHNATRPPAAGRCAPQPEGGGDTIK